MAAGPDKEQPFGTPFHAFQTILERGIGQVLYLRYSFGVYKDASSLFETRTYEARQSIGGVAVEFSIHLQLQSPDDRFGFDAV